MISGAQLLGLSALVIAQPILDALERSTYAFAIAEVTGLELMLLAAALVLLPPAVMLAVELVAGVFSRTLRGWVHLGWIGLLVALLCWQAIAQGEDTSGLVTIATLAAGLLGVVLFVRFEAVRLLLQVLAFAAPAVAALFLFTAPIRSFTLPAGAEFADTRIDSDTPVVLIIFDEFPLFAALDEQGRIDSARFPNFAALAGASDWFSNAVTVADTTEQAVPAILSGELAEPNGVAAYSDHPRTLFTLLGSSYESSISESVTALCPPQLCAKRAPLVDRLAVVTSIGVGTADSFPFDFSSRIASKLSSWFHLGVKPHVQVQSFLSTLRGGPDGSLNVLHVELPHVPWQYMASGRRYRTQTLPLGVSNTELWSASPGYTTQGLQRLTLQLEYTDLVLGRIVARLHKAGLYDRSLLAVVADHGASFIPGHSRRLLDPVNAGPILRVPLFVKLPGQRRGKRLRRPVRTIDLLPTIADVLGFRIPWRVDGSSLLGPSSSRGANTYMSDRENVVSVSPAAVAKGFKLAFARQQAIIGHGDVFTLGLSRSRLRRELRGARRLEVALENPGGTMYDPGTGTFPSLVYGRILDPSAEEPMRLIATLNGHVVAVGQSVDAGTRFTALIPPSAFHPGENRLELFAP